MYTTFTVETKFFELLKTSQGAGSGLPFQMDPSVSLYNYNPGDCRVVQYVPEDGFYFFFKATEFDASAIAPGIVEHMPGFAVFLYASRGADSSTTSPDAVHAAAQNAVASFVRCVQHTMFKRLLAEAVDPIVPGIRIPKVRISTVKNVLTYPIVENNSRSVTFWEIEGLWQNTDEYGENPGREVAFVEDRLHAMRDEDELS